MLLLDPLDADSKKLGGRLLDIAVADMAAALADHAGTQATAYRHWAVVGSLTPTRSRGTH